MTHQLRRLDRRAKHYDGGRFYAHRRTSMDSAYPHWQGMLITVTVLFGIWPACIGIPMAG